MFGPLRSRLEGPFTRDYPVRRITPSAGPRSTSASPRRPRPSASPRGRSRRSGRSRAARVRSRSRRCGRRRRTSAGAPRSCRRAGSRRTRPGCPASTGGRTFCRCSQSPSRLIALPLGPHALALLGASSRASTPRCRASRAPRRPPRARPCRCRGSPAPGALGVDHQLAPPGVDVARRLVLAGAEPLPRGVVATQHPVADLLADARAGRPPRARRARPARPAPAWCSRLARARASAAGSGEGTLSRRASHGSDSPWMNSVPAVTVNAISRSTSRCGVSSGIDEGGRQRDHAAHAGPAERNV